MKKGKVPFVLLQLFAVFLAGCVFDNAQVKIKNDLIAPKPFSVPLTKTAKVNSALKQPISTSAFNQVAANNYHLNQNYQEFSSNHDFSSYEGQAAHLNYDLVQSLRQFGNENFAFSDISVSALKLTNKNPQIVRFNDKISFNLKAKLTVQKPQTWRFLNNDFTLVSSQTYPFELKVDNQPILGDVSYYNDQFFLVWKIPQAQLSFNSQTYQLKPYNINPDFFSTVFPYKFDYLTNKLNYFQFAQKHAVKLKQIKPQQIQQALQNDFETQIQQNHFFFDAARILLNTFAQENVDFQQLLIAIGKVGASYLISYGLVNTGFDQLIEQMLVSNKPFIELFTQNKQIILDALNYQNRFGAFFSIIRAYIDKIKYPLRDDDSDYRDLISALNNVNLAPEIKTFITGPFLGVTDQPLPLLSLIITFLEKIDFNKIMTFLPVKLQNEKTKNLIMLSKRLLMRSKQQKLVGIYDVLFSQDDFFEQLIENLPLNEGLKKIFKMVTVENDAIERTLTNDEGKALNIEGKPAKRGEQTKKVLEGFSKKTLLLFIQELAKLTNHFFALNNNNPTKDWKHKYANLSITSSWVKTLVYDLSKNTVSFDFQIKYHLKQPIIFDLTVLKNLISTPTLITLLETKTQALKSLPALAIPFLKSNRRLRLKEFLFDFLPNKITIGKDQQNFFELNFAAQNVPFWFNPTQKQQNYVLGLSFPYTKRYYYQDFDLVASITQAYNPVFEDRNLIFFTSIKISLYYGQFLSAFLNYFFLRPYYITNRFFYSDATIPIATSDEYDDNLYISDYKIQTKEPVEAEAKTAYQTDLKERFQQQFQPQIYPINYTWEWKKSDKKAGQKTNHNQQEPELKGYYFLPQTDFGLSNTFFMIPYVINNKKAYFSYDVLVNAQIPVQMIIHQTSAKVLFTSINIPLTMVKMKLDLFIARAQLWFPFKVYDLTSKKLINYIKYDLNQIKLAQ